MTWRERLRRKLCWTWWSFRQGLPISHCKIPAKGLKPDHLMLVLPPDFHDFDVARNIVEPLVVQLDAGKVTVMLRENFRTWLSRDLKVNVRTFDVSKKNWLGLPTNGICDTARELGVDVAIDLTPGFSAYTSAICAASGAPLRITMDNEETHGFYNVQILSHDERSLADRYVMLLKYV